MGSGWRWLAPQIRKSSQAFASHQTEPRASNWAGFRRIRKIRKGAARPCNAIRHPSTFRRWPGQDADIAAFLDRRARLMRWRWSETDAEKLAERLVLCDREQDDRVSCTDCRHYRPGRCGNHRRAGLNGSDVGRDFAALLHRCSGFDGAT